MRHKMIHRVPTALSAEASGENFEQSSKGPLEGCLGEGILPSCAHRFGNIRLGLRPSGSASHITPSYSHARLISKKPGSDLGRLRPFSYPFLDATGPR